MPTAADPYGWAEIAALQQQAQDQGRTFDPTDPYNWRGIQQAVDPYGIQALQYSLPGLKDDLQYVAYKTGYDARKAQADIDAQMRQTKANEDYKTALANLEQQGLQTGRNMDNALLSRGVFNSGETVQRRADLAQALTNQRQSYDASLASSLGQINSDKMSALSSLESENAQQIAASKARLDARAATLTNSGTVTPAPSLPAPAYQPQSTMKSSVTRDAPAYTPPPQQSAPSAPRTQAPSYPKVVRY
jgi:hypothetical protein